MDICNEFLNNPEINPRTGRKIKIGATTYLKLQKECNTPIASSNTRNICQEFLNNPSKNPRTNRVISPTGKVYKDLMKECNSTQNQKVVPQINSIKPKKSPTNIKKLAPQLGASDGEEQLVPEIIGLCGLDQETFFRNVITNLHFFDKSKIPFIASKTGVPDFDVEEDYQDPEQYYYEGEKIDKNNYNIKLLRKCINNPNFFKECLDEMVLPEVMNTVAIYATFQEIYEYFLDDSFDDSIFENMANVYNAVQSNASIYAGFTPAMLAYSTLKNILLKYPELSYNLNKSFWETFASAGMLSYDIIVWYQYKELKHPCAIKLTKAWDISTVNSVKDWFLDEEKLSNERDFKQAFQDNVVPPYNHLKKDLKYWEQRKKKLIHTGFKRNIYGADSHYDYAEFPLVYHSKVFNNSKKNNPLYRKLQIEYILKFYAFYCIKKNQKYVENYVFGFEDDYELVQKYCDFKTKFENTKLIEQNFNINKNFGLCMYFIRDLPFWQINKPDFALKLSKDIFNEFYLDVRKFFV